MFHNLKSLLSGSLQRGGISQQLTEALVLEKYKEVISEILNSEEVNKVKTMYVRNKVLAVASLSEAITAKLQRKEGEIINKINKKLDLDALQKIKYIT